MDNSPQSINPSVKETLVLGVLLTVIWSGVYLFYPDIFEGIQFKLTDAIVAARPADPVSPVKSWSSDVDERIFGGVGPMAMAPVPFGNVAEADCRVGCPQHCLGLHYG
jgi:hypothetical protein